MSAQTQGHWKILPLRVTAMPESPPLLAKLSHSSDGYDVTISDLCRVWQERLTMNEVIQRAKDIKCAIEPDNAENFDYIMRELSEALCTPGALEVASSSDGQSITMKLKAKMQNLNAIDLYWEVRLERLPLTAIRDIIVLPLFRSVDNRRKQEDHLVKHIREKDHVIERLCDRLEMSGDALTTVLPGHSKIKLSRNKTQGEQLSQHVPGLGVYAPETRPVQHVGESMGGSTDMAMLMTDTLDNLGHSEVTNFADDWWNHVTSKDADSRCETTQKDAAVSKTEIFAPLDSTLTSNIPNHGVAKKGMRDADDDDGFQQQDVSKLAADYLRSAAQDDDQSSTDDDDDDDLGKAPSQRHASVSQSSVQPRNSRDSEPMSEAPEAPEAPVKRKLGALGGKKKTVPESESGPKEIEKRDDDIRSNKHANKLGTIGGRARARASTPVDEQASPDVISPPPKPKSKLGPIGGKIKQEPNESSSEVHTAVVNESLEAPPSEHVLQHTDVASRPGRAAERAEIPAPRETSQERADRKRDQLKHSLEDQNKAGAKKKKRKF